MNNATRTEPPALAAMLNDYRDGKRDMPTYTELAALLDKHQPLPIFANPKQNEQLAREAQAIVDADVAALAGPAAQESVHVTASELSCVINWLEGGCDPKDAAKELRLYRERASAPVAQQGGGELPQDERAAVRQEGWDACALANQELIRQLRAALAQRAASVPAQAGQQQEATAFENWAKYQNYDMTTHPLHWLFLDKATYAARQGWKAGIAYAVSEGIAAPVPAASVQPNDPPLTDLENQIADLFCIGSEARLNRETILSNVKNTSHFAELLHAVEHEFFMVPGDPDEDYPEEQPEPVCLVNSWGCASTEQYIGQVRDALAKQQPDIGRDAALLSAIRDGVPLEEPVSVAKAMMAQEKARVSLSGGTGPLAAVFLVNIQAQAWTHTQETATAYADGFNRGVEWLRSSIIEYADKLPTQAAPEVASAPDAGHEPVCWAHPTSIADMQKAAARGYEHPLGMVVLAKNVDGHEVALYTRPLPAPVAVSLIKELLDNVDTTCGDCLYFKHDTPSSSAYDFDDWESRARAVLAAANK